MPELTHPPSRAWRAVATCAVAVALAFGAAGPVAADPDPAVPSPEQVAAAAAATSDAAVRVAAIDTEIAASRAAVEQAAQEASSAAEAYNKTRTELEQRSREAAKATAAAQTAQQAAQTATAALSQHAAEVYQDGGRVSQLDVFFGGDLRSVLDRAAALEAMGEERVRVVRDAEAARSLAWAAQQAAGEARERQAAAEREAQQAAASAQARTRQAAAVEEQVQQRQDRLLTELAGLRHTSAQLERDREEGLAAVQQGRQEEENRRRVETRAAELARVGGSGSSGPAADAGFNAAWAAASAATKLPASRSAAPGGGAAVLAFARAHLGEPYVWGAAGPSTWDCSGLTMMAWREAGVTLGHYTGTQWAQTTPVALSQAQPGDLVFYGTSPADIHHVGLYVGNGTMIHAPRTGDVVKVSSVYSMGDLLPYVGRP